MSMSSWLAACPRGLEAFRKDSAGEVKEGNTHLGLPVADSQKSKQSPLLLVLGEKEIPDLLLAQTSLHDRKVEHE